MYTKYKIPYLISFSLCIIIVFYFIESNYSFYGKKLIQDPWKIEQELRKNKLEKVCSSLPKNITESHSNPKFFSYVPSEYGDGNGNLLICRVPKAGWSTWTYGSLTPLSDWNNTNAKWSMKAMGQFSVKTITNFRKIEENKPLRLILTRHPFERLMSAFLDKISGRTFQDFLQNMVIKEFDKGICSPGTPCCRMNRHWRPIYNHCFPCSVDWTVISKMETFSEDRWRVHSMLGLDRINQQAKKVQFNIAGGSKTKNLTRYEFSIAPESVKEKLRFIYKLDFELFDYDPFLY